MKETLKNDERNCFGLNLLYAEELEDAVVGAAMLETNSLNEIIGFVRPEMFYKQDNRYIWEAIEALVKAGLQPDLLMVAHKLAEMGRLEEAGGPYGVTRKTSKARRTSGNMCTWCMSFTCAARWWRAWRSDWGLLPTGRRISMRCWTG